MTNQNSSPDQLDNIVRPDDLMAELNLKSSTYYDDLKHLDIKAEKDENGKAYLTNDQAERVRALRSHVSKNGKRTGFEYAPLAVSDNNELAINENNNIEKVEDVEDIYVEEQEPTANLESNIIREAEELAARGMAMNDLIKIQLASQMSFDDLSPDLQDKINIAKEVANPKFAPATIAQQLLTQHRQQKAQIQGQE